MNKLGMTLYCARCMLYGIRIKTLSVVGLVISTVYYNGNAGSEETSEPKPVPSLLVGYEQEWLSISPHAIRYWV